MATNPNNPFDPFRPYAYTGTGMFQPGQVGQGSISTQSTTISAPMNKFKDGDRVVLKKISPSHCSSESNPLWGEKGIYIAGSITTIDSGGTIYITWDTGTNNVYVPNIGWEIELLSKVSVKKNAKLDTVQLDSVVMADDVRSEVIAVLKQQFHRDKLFVEWGLGDVIEYGRGMTFLFYGPPGTGKTWTAHSIAKALGTELITIGPGEIQSSEPGAANRNIQDAFKEATSSGKVLLLDECDSLTSSRSDLGMVLGGEVNTLLTEIEKFEGVAILATNRIENLDEALERRISLIVEFPEPTYDQRALIWKKLMPPKMPIAKDVDIKKLAEHKLTGSQIKNCVLQAARIAMSSESKNVNLAHIESAIARVKSSKSLMGTASRYRQIKVKEDFKVTKGHSV